MERSASAAGYARQPFPDHEYKRLQAEIEHHKNELIVADQKLSVINDIKQDYIHQRDQKEQSEQARAQLQQHIQQISEQVQEFQSKQKSLQEVLVRENDALKAQIQGLEQKAAKTLIEHNSALKQQADDHAKKEAANLATQDQLKSTHTDRLNQLIKEREADQQAHQAAAKKALDEQKAKDANHAKEMEAARAKLAETVKDMEARHAAQLKDHQAQHKKAQEDYARDLKTLSENRDTVVADLNAKLQAQLKQAKEDADRRDSQYKQDVATMEETHKKFVADVNASNDRNLRALESKYNQQIADVNARNAATLSEQDSRHQRLIQDVQKRMREEIDALDARYKKSVSDAQAQSKANLEALHKQYEGKLDELNQAHQAEINKYVGKIQELNELHSQEIKKYKQLIADQKAQHEENIRKIEANFNSLISDLQAKNSQLVQDLERSYNSQLADLQSKNRQHVDSLEAGHRKQVQELQDTFRAQTATMQTQHADLMQKTNTQHRATLDTKDREAQAAAAKYARDLADCKTKHQEEVARLTKLNQTQHDRTSAEYRKRDTDYNDSLEKLRAVQAAAVKKLDEELAKKEKTLKEELAAKEQSWQAKFKEWQAANLKQESRHTAASTADNSAHHKLISDLQAKLDSMLAQKHAEIVALQAKLEDQRSKYDLKIDQLEKTIKSLTILNGEKDAKIHDLENEVHRLQDIEKQYLMIQQHCQQLEQQKQALQDDLDGATQYITDLEDKFYKSQVDQLNLLKNLTASERNCDDMQKEIEVLRNYIIDLKSRIAVYIPVKDDKIDKKIAEYINNYPDRQKLKIMFMRETEGVYHFGSKRVGVKVDKDKINIRVGGGYLSIDEFLDQYTPNELEKLERKDPMKRFQEKVAMTKTIQGHEVARPASPDSPKKSPKKKLAI